MTDDLESVAMRPTVIDGQRQEDNYEVIWRGLPIGRIMKPPGEPALVVGLQCLRTAARS